ncbi:MAG: glycosyltransferase family 4 protein, partial [Gallionella sp.]
VARMKILFVHQNCPAQYVHLARHLAAISGNQVVFITQRQDASLPNVRKIVYKPNRVPGKETHRYLGSVEAGVLNAQEVARVALQLKQSGFVPDVMLGHNGWGEIWYLKDVFPRVPLIGYFEFFYRFRGADVGFDPEFQASFDDAPRLRTRNMANLIGLDAADLGQTASLWQKSVHPVAYQSRLQVIHEGIDTEIVTPNANARLRLTDIGIELTRADEVITYVARNLEPYRGFHSFIRSLPAILDQRSNARVVIIGGDEISYGAKLKDGATYKQHLLAELGSTLDLTRVHFLGKVPYPVYLSVLQISSVHVYLTYPFVLSWSMLEAMSAGCLLVASKTAPVEEVIRDGENGLLVDFFSAEEISGRVVDALNAGQDGYTDIRKNARNTILEQYDLKTICLPAQLRLLESALHEI